MSTTDGNASDRLTRALDEAFAGPATEELNVSDGPFEADGQSADQAAAQAPPPLPVTDPQAPPSGQPVVAGPRPYVLPTIVAATTDPTPPPVDGSAASAPTPPSEPSPPISSRAPAPAPAPVPTPEPAPASTVPSTTIPVTGWGDQTNPVPRRAHAGELLRRPRRRPRVRRVTRVVRHIDPWSTFKIAVIFSAVTYIVLLTAGVLLWRVAENTGTLDNVERWFTQFGWESFELKGDEIFSSAWVMGLFGIVGLTGAIVLLVTLFNLVSDIIGGIRVTVLEEEVIERTAPASNRYIVRRPPAGPTDPRWDRDIDEPAAPALEPTADWSIDDGETSDESAASMPTAAMPTVDQGTESGARGLPEYEEPTADWSVDDEPTAIVRATEPVDDAEAASSDADVRSDG